MCIFFEPGHQLEMVGLWQGVVGTDVGQGVCAVAAEGFEVAGQCLGTAAHYLNSRCSEFAQTFTHPGSHTAAWRVGNDELGGRPPAFGQERFGFHRRYAERSGTLGIGLAGNDVGKVASQERGGCASPGVEVVGEFARERLLARCRYKISIGPRGNRWVWLQKPQGPTRQREVVAEIEGEVGNAGDDLRRFSPHGIARCGLHTPGDRGRCPQLDRQDLGCNTRVGRRDQGEDHPRAVGAQPDVAKVPCLGLLVVGDDVVSVGDTR